MDPQSRIYPGSVAVDSCLHMFTHLSLGPIVGERNPGKDAKIEVSWWSSAARRLQLLLRRPDATPRVYLVSNGQAEIAFSRSGFLFRLLIQAFCSKHRMPITQIPFQDPVAPPEKPQPEQLGLYDTQDWETAYRDLDSRVPHLLIQLQDDLQRSRKREALWISVIVHLVIFIVLWNLPLIEKYAGWHSVVAVPVNLTQDKNVTFLPLPPDLQKAARKPKTNIMSDKDRIAMSRHPELDAKELRKILATPPPGAPGPSGPRAAQPAPATPQNQMPTQQPQQQAPATQRPQFQTDQTAQLQTPPHPANSFSKYATGMTAGLGDSAGYTGRRREPRTGLRRAGRRLWFRHGRARARAWEAGCSQRYQRRGLWPLLAADSAGCSGKLVSPDSGIRGDEEGEAGD